MKEIIKSGKKLRFHTPNGLHGRYIDEELAELMVRANFKTIRISLESISGDRRSDIDGKINCTQMEIAINNLKTAGFDPNAIDTYIIMGLPDQSLREVAESIRYAHGLGVQIRLTSYSPIPGTRDYGKAVESGYFPDDADPLLTNKTIIPLYRTEKAYQRFQHLRQLTKQLNQHELTPDEFQRNISTPEKKI